MALTEEKLEKIETLLANERSEWSKKIQELVKSISEPNKLAKAQTHMLSYRHMIVDKIMDLRVLLSKKKANDSNFTKHDINIIKQTMMLD